MGRLSILAANAINRISARMPPGLGRWLRNRTWPSKHPTLHYLEFHIADHCNMNCGGCLHFAPYAPRWFADAADVEKDFSRLKALFGNIRHVRVMGGEPLLHPECARFLGIVRDAFRDSCIELVTNGLLLEKQDGDFWEVCRRTNATISLSVYPPVKPLLPKLHELCRRKNVPLYATPSETFMARYVPDGSVDAVKSFRHCRGEAFFCPILRKGRIYKCAMGCYARFWNDVSPHPFPPEEGLSLETADGPAILDYLMRPMPACAYCSPEARLFQWRRGEPKLEDWLKQEP